MSADAEIPEGFTRHNRPSGLTQPWEPIYAARREEAFSLGLYAAQAHVNSRGFVHGGLLCALADNAMGLSCAYQIEGCSGLLTVNISMDYLGSGQLGDWIEVRAQPRQLGKSLCFAEASVYADNHLCATARAVFKLLPIPADKGAKT
ncbi:PaaI family thioesterase [Halopseudomonas salegens]|uniref:Uncharacterized domain 1-containing protein n=1 Tax=Halopseudomonas salegens TaxID=1434072 RepID=A0A1H2FDM0_9GAMM|nr:PaaI family thioesterase [Halopseudomonas salegens]SDU05375.1 uncharacterized domain 1-containing protein [Halopseudomonas salegens]